MADLKRSAENFLPMFKPHSEERIKEHILRRVGDRDFDDAVARSNRRLMITKLGVPVLLPVLAWTAYFRRPEVGMFLPFLCTFATISIIGYLLETRDRTRYTAMCIRVLRGRSLRE